MSVNDGGDPSVTPLRELALVCPLPQRQLVLLCPHHITIIYVAQSYHHPTGVVFRLWGSGFTIQRLVFWASGD